MFKEKIKQIGMGIFTLSIVTLGVVGVHATAAEVKTYVDRFSSSESELGALLHEMFDIDGYIDPILIRDGSIASIDITDESITNIDIADGTIRTEELADNSVNSDKIINESVTNADIDDGTIRTQELADNSVNSDKVIVDSLTAVDLAANSVGNSELSDDITVQYLRGNFGDMLQSTDEWLRLNQSSNHTAGTYSPLRIRADGGFQVDGVNVVGSDARVEGDRIRQNTVDSSEIENDSITENDISDSFVARSSIKVNQGSAYSWIGNLSSGTPRSFNSNGLSVGFVRSSTNGAPISYGMLLNVPSYTSGQDGGAGQILFPYDQGYTGNGNPMFRVGDYNNSGWAAWKTFLDKDWGDSSYINVGESGDSIADNTIDGSEIQDNSLTASDLAANSVGDSELTDTPTISSLNFIGVGGNSGNAVRNYSIYQEGGAWASPYPDLVIGYHTGVKIGGHRNYGGTRFYNDAPGRSGSSIVMEVANGNNDVKVTNNLNVGGTVTASTPTSSNHLATKSYVDNKVSSSGGETYIRSGSSCYNSDIEIKYIQLAKSCTGGTVCYATEGGDPNCRTGTSCTTGNSGGRGTSSSYKNRYSCTYKTVKNLLQYNTVTCYSTSLVICKTN